MKDIDIHITARRLLTSMFYVLAFALALYATTAVVRLVVHLLFRRRKNSKS